MPAPPRTPTSLAPLTSQERVELACRLYREYRARCFWHCPRDLVITEDLIPLIVKGLRKHGGRRGFILAEQLEPRGVALRPPESEEVECR